MSELRLELRAGALTADLESIKRRLSNPAPLMRSLSVELLSMTEHNFAKEAQSGGPKWPGLAASTIEQRKKSGRWPGLMLQRSAGGLAASVQPFHSATEAGLSVSKPYAAIHQFGGQAGRGKKVTIPARPYLPMRMSGSDLDLTEPARESMLQMLGDFINGPG